MRRLLLVLVILLTVAAPAATLHRTPAAAQEPEIIGPNVDDYPDGVNPLTGLVVDDPTLTERRPIIVKVVNAPDEARPQWGLMEADVIWEYLLAGSWTRFAAVFYGNQPERVGPIRSLRLPDFEFTRIYRSLIVTSGMAIGEKEILFRDALMLSRILSGEDPCPALCRDLELDRKWEFTLYGNIPELYKLAAEIGRDVEPEPVYGMAFSETVPAGGQAITKAEIKYLPYTHVTWTYNAAENVWYREHNEAPHMDVVTEEQLHFDNVMIVEAEHWLQPYVYEEYWGYENYAYSTNFIGEGRVFLLRDGQYIEGKWQRATREDPLSFVDLEANPLAFKPGTTFFNLVPQWAGSHELALHLVDAPTATVIWESVFFHWGPTENFGKAGWAYEGDTFQAIGRNTPGTWVQLVYGINSVWVDASLVELSVDIMDLPRVRPLEE
ncbi:MAG: DUF3048 domain-containing protein [Anaerolineae bacterium]|nr:DUF3048 domain-containing protein [Anaerolineae bacterium]